MSAQPGNNVVLSYGPQGSRQTGAAIVLEYTPADVPRVRVSARARAPWSASATQVHHLAAPSPATASLSDRRRMPWGAGRTVHAESAHAWGVAEQRNPRARTPWGAYARHLHHEPAMPWRPGQPVDHNRAMPWPAWGQARSVEPRTPWRAAVPTDHNRVTPWGGPMARRGRQIVASTPASLPVDLNRWLPWTRYSRPLNPGWGLPTPPGPQPNPDGTFVVPILQAYIVLTSATLIRVDTGDVIPATAMSIALDADSWTWTFSASMRAADRAMVLSNDGVPVEVQAAVNGNPFRFVVEGVSRDRAFGADQLRITGRGLSAELASPYAPQLTFRNASARTAQQLIADALTVNGVPLDWTVEWMPTDWLVPAGAFSLQGAYIDAVKAVAEAAGAFIQPDPVTRVLRILPTYPVAPWEWSTTPPDFELPSAVVARESTEWVTRPAYNRVFVSGVNAGVLGQITRAGTAGDLVAPMVTDPLATHADAVRQRGLAVLANTGRQLQQSLRLPILEETGVIRPGSLVRYIDGATTRVGMVRATQVEASHAVASQTISLEVHLDA
jgi:hypothetical protein